MRYILIFVMIMFATNKIDAQFFPWIPHVITANTTTLNLSTLFPPPCLNGDAELNNMTGWKQYCAGGFSPMFSMPLCSDIARVKPVGVGSDPYCGFPRVFQGNYSMQIGNSQTGG